MGIARSSFILNGQKFEFGSTEEVIAIQAFNRQRTIQFFSAAATVVGPEGAQKVIDSLHSAIFPETRIGDIDYMKKQKEYFEKLKKVDLRVK